MRKINFENEEYYHIFNRGIDKRKIFSNQEDFDRFLQSINEFNSLSPIDSIYENTLRKKKFGGLASKPLINLICYCLNPNHFHLILQQATDKGVEKFMHRLGTGYTMFFNEKYKRSGSLFQGTYKAKYINSDEYLLYASVYVNLNHKAHLLKDSSSKSSWQEYIQNQKGMCQKNIILNQFKSAAEYKKYAIKTIEIILEKKINEKEDLEA